jgi:RNA polymerase sigma-70 factor (ECF subfamily)
MSSDPSFIQRMIRLREGDKEVAAEVFERFTGRLIARSHLDTLIRQKEDPEDVVQSVYKSFFLRHEAGQFQLMSWNELWSLLTVFTVRKCADRADYFRAQRRDAAREVVLEPGGDKSASRWQAPDPQPTPEEAALLAETVEKLLSELDPDDRPVIELSLQGYTVAEISAGLSRAERSVRRLREHVRGRLEGMLAGEGL